MYLKMKAAGDNGRWKLIEIEEVEWDTTWGELSDSILEMMDSKQPDEARPFIDKRCGIHFISMLVRKKGADSDFEIYCNTQAYVLNDKGETLETLVRRFPKEKQQLNTN